MTALPFEHVHGELKTGAGTATACPHGRRV